MLSRYSVLSFTGLSQQQLEAEEDFTRSTAQPGDSPAKGCAISNQFTGRAVQRSQHGSECFSSDKLSGYTAVSKTELRTLCFPKQKSGLSVSEGYL